MQITAPQRTMLNRCMGAVSGIIRRTPTNRRTAEALEKRGLVEIAFRKPETRSRRPWPATWTIQITAAGREHVTPNPRGKRS